MGDAKSSLHRPEGMESFSDHEMDILMSCERFASMPEWKRKAELAKMFAGKGKSSAHGSMLAAERLQELLRKDDDDI